MATAWHLRQDGKAFPVIVHIYGENDSTLASEAECAAFLIETDSADGDYAKFVLDAWMAFLIENSVSYDAGEDEINEAIFEQFQHLGYHLQISPSNDSLLRIHRECQNYNDVDSLYAFIDDVRSHLFEVQESIKRSVNQQFCRVRYGGKYDTKSDNHELWIRISSKNFDWSNTIYHFILELCSKSYISDITICRDNESDGREEDVYHKAKDGSIIYHMPINDFCKKGMKLYENR